MDLLRFHPEVALPFSAHGSLLRVAPLAGEVTSGAVNVLHLPPGGRVGRHAAPSPQLLAVVAGSGWASGSDGVRRELGPGYAVSWHADEEHEVDTDDGLTAVVLEGIFEVSAFRVTREIVVSDPDPMWPTWFEQVRAVVWPAVREVARRLEHVGSTSVPGLAAKPIIDADVVVATEQDVQPAIERLAGVGYRWRGELGVEGRQAFHPPREPALPAHHLYLVVEGSRAHLDHVLLRDLLREDPEARERYASLKRANVERAAGDIDAYTAAKAALVAELLTRARSEHGHPPVDYWVPEP